MSLFKDEQAHPLVLLRQYLRMFGRDSLEWAPAVIKTSVEDKTGTTIAKVNLLKLMAAISVANHDSFWKDWETFHLVSQALNNNIPSPGVVQDQTVGQLMVAVDMATQVREDLGAITAVPTFSEEVARYIAAQVLESCIWYLPEPLDFANKYAAGEMQKCRVCGNVEERQVDRLCSFCTDRYETDSLLKFEPSENLVERGQGKEVDLFDKYPADKVQARLADVLSKNIVLRETQVDICVAKLLTGVEYMKHRRNQLVVQGAV